VRAQIDFGSRRQVDVQVDPIIVGTEAYIRGVRATFIYLIGSCFTVTTQAQEVTGDIRSSASTDIIALSPKIIFQNFVLPAHVRIHIRIQPVLNDTQLGIAVNRRLIAGKSSLIGELRIIISTQVLRQPVET